MVGIPVSVGVSKAWAKGTAVWYEGTIKILKVSIRLDIKSGVQNGFREGSWGRVDGLLICVEVEENSGNEWIGSGNHRHLLTKFD